MNKKMTTEQRIGSYDSICFSTVFFNKLMGHPVFLIKKINV